jgi:hypothetical protein
MKFRNVSCNSKIFLNVLKFGDNFYELYIKILSYSSYCIVTVVARKKSLKYVSLQEKENRCGPDKLKTLYYHRNRRLDGFNTADSAVRNWILASLIPPHHHPTFLHLF